MFQSKTIQLFWWSEPLLMGKPKENYGDLIGKYLVEKIARKHIQFTHPKKVNFKTFWKPIYLTAGSILAQANKNCIVWGSGIIQKDQVVKPAKFLAVRGPQTRKNLLAQGYDVPEIYGDPALLLPKYYHPKIEKSYRLGIVPHYNDYKTVYKMYKANPEVLVINLMTNHIEETTNLFLQCEHIVSSSLHGLIISHAYQIPAVWVEFSKNLFGDGIKFQDYFESIDIISYQAVIYDKPVAIETFMELFKTDTNLPSLEKIEQVQKDLMSVCPFV